MGLIFQWTSLVPVAEASGAVLILMGNVQMSYGHLAVVTILVLCSKPMSIVALMGLGVVGPQTFQGFLKIGALLLIVTLKMIPLVCLLVLLVPTIALCFAHRSRTDLLYFYFLLIILT